jgi:hypothetical protein
MTINRVDLTSISPHQLEVLRRFGCRALEGKSLLMAGDEPRKEIERIWTARQTKKFPRGDPRTGPSADAVLSLAEYDGYIGGLASRYLHSNKLGVDRITIPRDLERTFEAPEFEAGLESFRATWAELRALAELLAQDSGVPLERTPSGF